MNVLDMYGNNTMLSQAKDEEGMSRFYAFVCTLFLTHVKSSIHRMDIIDRFEWVAFFPFTFATFILTIKF